MSPYTLEVEHPDLGNDQVVSVANPASTEAPSNVAERNAQHEQRLEQIQNVLRPALNTQHAIDWDRFKHDDAYSEPKPATPTYLEYPPEPQPDDSRFQPQLAPADLPGTPEAEKKKREAYEDYVNAYTAWAEAVKRIEGMNLKRYEAATAAVEEWNRGSRIHEETQAAYNLVIDQRKADYESCRPDAVEEYCRQVLSTSRLPDPFQRVFDLQYLPETKSLIVEHSLPAPADLPRVKGVKYLKSRGVVDVPLSATASNRIYADVLHQVSLRTLHELYDADTAGALDNVIFNGWVQAPDPVTGEQTRIWLMSAQTTKAEFQALNLWDTDAKACFKALKGEAKSKLHAFASVTPKMRINCLATPDPVPLPIAQPAPTWTETDQTA